jgi:heptosyltransferase-2
MLFCFVFLMAKALDIATFTVFSPWIKKEAWTVFDNDTTSIAVHLKDYYPEIYTSINHPKKLKKEALKLYQKFSFDLFKDKLVGFFKQF